MAFTPFLTSVGFTGEMRGGTSAKVEGQNNLGGASVRRSSPPQSGARLAERNSAAADERAGLADGAPRGSPADVLGRSMAGALPLHPPHLRLTRWLSLPSARSVQHALGSSSASAAIATRRS